MNCAGPDCLRAWLFTGWILQSRIVQGWIVLVRMCMARSYLYPPPPQKESAWFRLAWDHPPSHCTASVWFGMNTPSPKIHLSLFFACGFLSNYSNSVWFGLRLSLDLVRRVLSQHHQLTFGLAWLIGLKLLLPVVWCSHSYYSASV